MVQEYLRGHGSDLEEQLGTFKVEASLRSAASRASLAETPEGKRYSHQRRIRKDVLREARRRLLELDLARIREFAELHHRIENALDTLHGAGELFVYDTALRIGARLGVLPDLVYLHRGTRAGARALGLPWKERAIPVNLLPVPVRGLSPHEIEDFLCIYKVGLQRSSLTGPSSSGAGLSRKREG